MYYGRMEKLTENSFKFASENKQNISYRPHTQAHQQLPHVMPQLNHPKSQFPTSQVLYQPHNLILQQSKQKRIQQQQQQQQQKPHQNNSSRRIQTLKMMICMTP